MEHIYIAMVDTPGIFAAVIRRFLRQRYIHVVLGMDAGLEEAYSFGRRNPRVPWFAGFEREDKKKILRAFPTAVYQVCELECSAAQKAGIRERAAAGLCQEIPLPLCGAGAAVHCPWPAVLSEGSVYLFFVYSTAPGRI